MKHISVLVPRGNVITDTIIGSYTLLKMANAHHKKINGLDEPIYKIDLVGITDDPVQYGEIFQITPTTSIKDITKTDLIVVTAITGKLERQVERNKEFVSWIRDQRIQNDADVGSLCKGAVLLAETGLLNNKSCATHWTIHNEFRKLYPQVDLLPEKIISEDNGIYSSGGAYSFLNFIIYLIEKYFGRETAIWCSKISEIEFDRIGQSHFMIFSGQKEHEDETVMRAQQYIEEHFEEKLNVDDIASMFNISSRNFLRRFKKATSNTPLEYVQRVKIEAAKKQLESTSYNIQETMFYVGYNDEKAFRKVFKKYTGLSPLEYRNKYNREMAVA